MWKRCSVPPRLTAPPPRDQDFLPRRSGGSAPDADQASTQLSDISDTARQDATRYGARRLPLLRIHIGFHRFVRRARLRDRVHRGRCSRPFSTQERSRDRVEGDHPPFVRTGLIVSPFEALDIGFAQRWMYPPGRADRCGECQEPRSRACPRARPIHQPHPGRRDPLRIPAYRRRCICDLRSRDLTTDGGEHATADSAHRSTRYPRTARDQTNRQGIISKVLSRLLGGSQKNWIGRADNELS